MAVSRRSGSEWRSVPMAPGVPQHIVDDVLVLPYGKTALWTPSPPTSMSFAAVFGRTRPKSATLRLQPRAFLERLRDSRAPLRSH